MREISDLAAETSFRELLDEVSRGGEVVITRAGRPVARLVRETRGAAGASSDAVDAILALRERVGRMSIDEILSARHEGHRY